MLIPCLAAFSIASFAVTIAGAGTAPSTPGEASLVAALPSNTIAVVHLPNPRGLMASRETNRWVGFATDAEWNRLMGPVLAAIGDDIAESEIPEWRERALGAMEDSTDLVGFVAGEPGGEEPTLGLIVRGGDQCAALLRRFIGTDARTETIAGGEEVLLSAAGRAELYYEADGLILVLSTPTVEGSKAVASECLSSLAAGELPALLSRPGVAERRQPEAAFEFALNLDLVWDALRAESPDLDAFQARLLESASTIEWMYGTGEFGLGETADWNIYLPYGEDSLIGDALGFFGKADTSLLSMAPAGSISATVAAFDISGFTDWALDVVQGASEEAHAQAMAGLSAAESAVGVNLIEDIIRPMEGQFLGFSSAPSAADAGSLMALSNLGATTLVALTENTEPLLDLFESLVEMSGMGQAISTEEVSFADEASEMELWSSDPSTGLPMTVGVGHGRLMISLDQAGSRAYLDLLRGTEGAKALLDGEDLAKAVAAASGCVITIQPTVAFADALEGFGAMLDAMNPEIWLPDQDAELNDEKEAITSMADAFSQIAALGRQYFSGTTTTEAKIGGGMMHFRTHSK